MKRISSLVLAALLVLALSACSAAPAPATPTAPAPAETPAPSPAASDAPAEGSASPTASPEASDASGGILIAYFSVPETDGVDAVAGASRVVVDGAVLGSNQYVAQLIQAEVGGDLFRIEPANPYTSDYDALLDIAQAEQREDTRPALAATVDNWGDYDTIFLGYPVWWYEAPQIIKTFAESYDFAGKTVVPFATSGGSSITGTIPAIRELCPGAEFREGLTLDGDRVSSQLDRIEPWLGEQGAR